MSYLQEEPKEEELINVDIYGEDWQLNKKKVLERNQYALENASLSDCSFLVGKATETKVFKCHKMILAFASPVFKAMFFSGIAEKEGDIIINDVNPGAFKSMLEYIYTDKINITSFDLGCDLLYAAKKYFLSFLVEKCKIYLCNNLNHENVCRVYEFSKFLDEQDIVEQCLKMMRAKTDQIIKNPTFEEIEQTTLVKLLEQDLLTVASEMDLIDASLHWAKSEAERKELDPNDEVVLRNILGSAFPLLRFLTLTPSQFASGPALSNILTRDESLAILVNLNSPGKMEIPSGICTITEQRCCSKNNGFGWNTKPTNLTRICQRQQQMSVSSKIFDDQVTFTVNEKINFEGVQVSSQIKESGTLDDLQTYNEVVAISLHGPNGNIITKTCYKHEVKYNSVLDIKFEEPVEVIPDEKHTLKVWFQTKGYYPKSSLHDKVEVEGVVFKFENSTCDAIQSLFFHLCDPENLLFLFKSTTPFVTGNSPDSSGRKGKKMQKTTKGRDSSLSYHFGFFQQ